MEEKAARAYDLAALKYWGPTTHINFPVSPVWILVKKLQVPTNILFPTRTSSYSFQNSFSSA